jgi:hypothetical protein
MRRLKIEFASFKLSHELLSISFLNYRGSKAFFLFLSYEALY